MSHLTFLTFFALFSVISTVLALVALVAVICRPDHRAELGREDDADDVDEGDDAHEIRFVDYDDDDEDDENDENEDNDDEDDEDDEPRDFFAVVTVAGDSGRRHLLGVRGRLVPDDQDGRDGRDGRDVQPILARAVSPVTGYVLGVSVGDARRWLVHGFSLGGDRVFCAPWSVSAEALNAVAGEVSLFDRVPGEASVFGRVREGDLIELDVIPATEVSARNLFAAALISPTRSGYARVLPVHLHDGQIAESIAPYTASPWTLVKIAFSDESDQVVHRIVAGRRGHERECLTGEVSTLALAAMPAHALTCVLGVLEPSDRVRFYLANDVARVAEAIAGISASPTPRDPRVSSDASDVVAFGETSPVARAAGGES